VVSEYRYYEFLAVDRPLTGDVRDATAEQEADDPYAR